MTDSLIPPPGEQLTSGWEPDLPADDTLVRRAVLVHASWPVEVARSAGRPWCRTPGWAGAWIGDRGALTNPVVLVQPPLDVAAVVSEVADLFPPGVPYLLLSPWPTADLTPRGLALLGHPPLMVRFPTGAPVAATTAAEVREVTDAEGLAVAERVLVEGYPLPEMQPLTPGSLLGPSLLDGTTRVWLAYDRGEAVAVAAAHSHGGATLVEYVATLPSARGRGVGAAVTWAATTSEPDQPAVLIASDDGRPVYERLGYVAVERWTAWLRPGSPGH